jgi:DNA invertase Pin-like site-specific DNA recombinase
MSEKAIIIARVSTLKQEKEGLSLQEIQLPLLRDYARDKGFVLDKETVKFVRSSTTLSFILRNTLKSEI